MMKSDWRKGCCILILIVLAVLGMYQWLLLPPYMPKALMSYDYCRYFGPQAYYLDSAIHHGEFPLWNPLTLCGTPFAPSPQQTAFYPPHLVRSLLTPAPTPLRTHLGLLALVLLHSMFAGAGAYLLARDYKMTRGAALVAGLAYMFGPHFVRRVLEQWILVAVASYLPFLWLLLRRAMYAETWRARLRYAAGGGLLLGMSVLAGFPQLSFYTAITLGLVLLLERLFFATWDDVRHPSRLPRAWFRDGVVLALLGVIGALTAAALLAPAQELISGSTRIKGGGYEVEAYPQDMSPKYLVQSLLAYPGATIGESGCRAAGIVSLLLAFTALFHTRRRMALLFLALYLALTDCTIGPPLPLGTILDSIDFFQFSSPWRAGILAGLPFALLVGLGAEKAAAGFASRGGTLAYSVAAGVLGLVVLLALLYWYRTGNYLEIGPEVLIIPGAGIGCVVGAAWLRRPRYTAALLVLFVFAEIFAWNYTYVPQFIHRTGYKQSLVRISGSNDIWQGNARGTDTHPNYSFYALQPASNGYDPLCLKRVRETIGSQSKQPHYLRQLRDREITRENQRGNLFIKRHFWLTRQYVRGPLPPKSDLFPPATTVYLPDPPPDIALPEAPSDTFKSSVSENAESTVLLAGEQLALVTTYPRRNDAQCTLPEITLDHRHAVLVLTGTLKGAIEVIPHFKDVDSTRIEQGKRYLFGHPTEREVTMEIPLPAMDRISPAITWKYTSPKSRFFLNEARVVRDNADEDDHIRIIKRGFNYVEVELRDLSGPRCLLYVDAAYSGWQATVDGVPTQVLTANDVFKAVCVQPGTHRVRFEFHPPRVPLGIGVSVATVLAAVAFLILTRTAKERGN